MKRFWMALAGALLVGSALMLWWGPRLVNQQWLKSRVVAYLSGRVGGRVDFDAADLKFFPRLQVKVIGARVWVPGTVRGELAEAILYPRLLPLLTGRVALAAAHVSSPDVILQLPAPTTDSGGARTPLHREKALPAILPLLPAPDALPFDLTIRNGRFDLSRGGRPLLALTDLDFRIRSPRGRRHFKLSCSGSLWEHLTAAGEVPEDQNSLQGHAEISGLRPFPLLNAAAPAVAGRLQFSPVDLTLAFTLNPSAGLVVRLKSPTVAASLTSTAGQASLAARDVGVAVALDDAGLKIGLESLQLEEPAAALSGRLLLDRPSRRITVALEGGGVDLGAVNRFLQTLVGDNPVVAEVLGIVRDGRVSRAHFEASAGRAEGLMDWENFRIQADLADGSIVVPGLGLELNGVAGEVLISQGLLTGSGLQARLGKSSGRDGQLALGLTGAADAPFALDLEVDADLSQLPPILRRIGGPPGYLAELTRLDEVRGRGRGHLKLGSRLANIQTTVTVAEFELAAGYDRLPDRLALAGGSFFFDAKHLEMDGVNARMGSTTLTGVSARLECRPPFRLEISSLQGRIALTETVPWLMGFQSLQAPLARLAPLTGVVELAGASFNGPVLAPQRWQYQANGRVADCSAGPGLLGAPLEIAGGRFQAKKEGLQFSDATLTCRDARLTAAGSLTGFPGATSRIEMTLEGTLQSASAGLLLERLGVPPEISVRTPLKVASGLFKWEAGGATAFVGSVITAGGPTVSLDVRQDRQKLLVHQFRIQDGEKMTTMGLGLEAGVVRIDFSGHLDRETLDKLITSDRLPTGWLSGEFHARIPIAAPLEATARGHLAGEHILLPAKLARPLEINAIQLEGRDDALEIVSADLSWNGQRFDLQGTVRRREGRLLADLDASAVRIDGNEIMAAAPNTVRAAALPPGEEGQPALPLAGRLGVRVETFTLGEYTWQPLGAEVTFGDRRVEVALQDAVLCGIRTDGFVTLTESDVRVDLKPAAVNAVLEDALDCLWDKGEFAAGHFDLTGSLFGAAPAAELRSRLAGPFSFQAREGRIYRFNLLAKIFALLNITEIYRGELPDLGGQGIAYSRIDVAGTLEEGRLLIEKAVLDAPSMKIVCGGSVDLIGEQMDLTFLVAPLKTVDRIVEWLPMVSQILEGTLISFPVRATGDLRNPTLVPLSPSAVGAGLFGILKNVIKLPVTLIQPLTSGTGAED